MIRHLGPHNSIDIRIYFKEIWHMNFFDIGIWCLSGITFVELIQYLRYDNLQRTIQRCEQEDPFRLRRRIIDRYLLLLNLVQSGTWQINPLNEAEVTGLANIEGVIDSPKPIKSSTDGGQLAIQLLCRYSEELNQDIRVSRGYDIKRLRAPQLIWDFAPDLHIKSANYSATEAKCELRGDLSKVILLESLNKISKSGWFGGLFEKKKSMKEDEFGIKLKASVCAFGTFTLNIVDGTFEIKPLFLGRTKGEIVAAVAKRKNIWKFLALVTGGLLAAAQLYKLYKNWKIKNAFEGREISAENALPEDYLCCICMTEPKNVILLPCNHFIVCKACFEKLESPQCPKCRADIQEYMLVFH